MLGSASSSKIQNANRKGKTKREKTCLKDMQPGAARELQSAQTVPQDIIAERYAASRINAHRAAAISEWSGLIASTTATKKDFSGPRTKSRGMNNRNKALPLHITTHFFSFGADGIDTSVQPALLATSYAAPVSLPPFLFFFLSPVQPFLRASFMFRAALLSARLGRLLIIEGLERDEDGPDRSQPGRPLGGLGCVAWGGCDWALVS